tara:strand:+ start:91 stop:918 length:828 start_codon:yes stop_codon:yes gene_type:complete
MSLKSILCAYGGETSGGGELRHALRLADHHGAHLTGVLRHGNDLLQSRHHAMIPHDLMKQLRNLDTDRITEVKRKFARTIEKSGMQDRSEFISLEPEGGVRLSELARHYDLIVTGPHSGATAESHLSANPDTLALNSGRPVLVVPDGFEAEGLSRHAIIAWDGKKSAARALGDAMATLEEKAKVTVLTIGKTLPAAMPGGGIMTLLERHGIHAVSMHVDRDRRSIARIIAEAAQKVGAELLVMGAFEHSKFSQDIFGGVTHDILKAPKIPVLMSH